MLIILGLILISLIVIVGGDRGVVSLIALVGNLLLLSFAIWLMATGVPVLFVTVGAGIVISCITLFYQNGTNVRPGAHLFLWLLQCWFYFLSFML